MLAVEIIEGCNFECYFCTAKDIKTPVYMDFDLFKRTILEAKELGITKINLTPCKGEPFLHPNIYEMLDFVNTHMKESMLFTNATAINVDKLKAIGLNNIVLCVSYYGSTIEKFNELTGMGNNLFKIFHRKLAELTDAGIKYDIHKRDDNYIFDYLEGPHIVKDDFDSTSKCKYHHEPKVFANGDVTFCIFAREEFPTSDKIFFANVNNISLKEALENPLRYKFYESQSICAGRCSSYDRNCYIGHSIISLKTIMASKKKYLENKEVTDGLYKDIEDETI